MHMNQYQALAQRTMNPALDTCDLIDHAKSGLVAEVGELHSLFQKKHQGHPLDALHMKKELGDVLWFIAEFCTAYGWTLEEVAKLNIEKLKARYPESFREENSLYRMEGDI